VKTVLQRVRSGRVTVAGKVVGSIETGLIVFVGLAPDDNRDTAERLAKKILNCRIFEDSEGRMNRSVLDIKGEILAISQFTLMADTRKGNRPGYSGAMVPEEAEPLYQHFVEYLRGAGLSIAEGVFGAEMEIRVEHYGPVTIIHEL
jgi:D-tyrosyl-tRNA(Tyr) deacylase